MTDEGQSNGVEPTLPSLDIYIGGVDILTVRGNESKDQRAFFIMH